MSEFIGNVGERLVLTLKAIDSTLVHGGYGTSTLITFVDADGRVVKWFASGEKDFPLGIVAPYEATIKKHEYFADKAETHVKNLSPHLTDKVKKYLAAQRKAARKRYLDAKELVDNAWTKVTDSDPESIAEYRRLVREADALFHAWKSIGQ